MRRARVFAALVHLASVASLVSLGCDDGSSAVKEPPPNARPGGGPGSGPDGGPSADGGDGGPSDCVMNPRTHLEIINACTNAVKITKNPVLPKLLPDGGLPPLS